MAVTADAPAPYAPAKAVLEVISRFRRGLPAPFTPEILARAGIPESIVPRTLQALQTLDLIEPNGTPTQTLETLRRAAEPDFQPKLAEWLNAAYADVLNFIDPATATESQVLDAFRGYNPVGQQPRMVTLFTGLYAAAGVRSPSNERSTTRSPLAVRLGRLARAPARTPPNNSRSASEAKNDREAPHDVRLPGVPLALSGLLATLPSNGGWTKARRDSFMTAFGVVLDYCFPITETKEADIATDC